MANDRLPRSVDVVGRRAAGLDMLRAGASYDAIASTLGYVDAAYAKKDIDRLLVSEVDKSREEHRALELSRLSGLIMAHWAAAKRGDGPSTDRISKLIDLRAKILGLYAPTRTEVVSIDAIEAEMSRLSAEIESKN